MGKDNMGKDVRPAPPFGLKYLVTITSSTVAETGNSQSNDKQSSLMLWRHVTCGDNCICEVSWIHCTRLKPVIKPMFLIKFWADVFFSIRRVKAKPSWFTVYCPLPHVYLETEQNFIIHCSSFTNHFLDSVYVWAAFTAKITVLGTNWMMVYPLKSSKIISELSKFL